jgi:formylglycine-generating enzyme required for sulfatase activity
MKLVLVKPGRFQMGCPPGEQGTDAEKPQHWVEITRPFYMGSCEVTQGEYEAVTGKNPSFFKTAKGGLNSTRLPVERVMCAEVEEFCRLLSAREKDKGRQYRLPTEAEWEYACRGGHKYKTSAPFYFKEPTSFLDTTQANFYGGEKQGLFRQRTMPVGSFQPNALGLFDMHGNVWEWCADDKRTYHKESATDPVGGKTSGRRVIRGGSWNTGSAVNCSAACRTEVKTDLRNDNLGFRLCVSAGPP